MKPRIIALAALCLALTGCVMHLVDRMTGEADAQEIRKDGAPAMARVVSIRDTGITVNQDPVVAFHLLVHPDGVEAFEAEAKARIGRLDIPRIQPGAEIPVIYDAHDHARVAIDLYER